MTECNWWVYIIEASDGRLYTGITTDLQRRWHEHNHTRAGAKFFRGRKPRRLRWSEGGYDRAGASRREAAIKRLTRAQKLHLMAGSVAT